jgi:hypothetical protein
MSLPAERMAKKKTAGFQSVSVRKPLKTCGLRKIGVISVSAAA